MESKHSEFFSELEKSIVISLIEIEEKTQNMTEESKKKNIIPIIYPPPRLFRKSLIIKTKKLFKLNKLFEEKKVIVKCRPLRDKKFCKLTNSLMKFINIFIIVSFGS